MGVPLKVVGKGMVKVSPFKTFQSQIGLHTACNGSWKGSGCAKTEMLKRKDNIEIKYFMLLSFGWLKDDENIWKYQIEKLEYTI